MPMFGKKDLGGSSTMKEKLQDKKVEEFCSDSEEENKTEKEMGIGEDGVLKIQNA